MNIQHHVWLIVTTVARCLSSLTAKCDRFHCQMAQKTPTCYGMHFPQFYAITTAWQRTSVVGLYRLQLI